MEAEKYFKKVLKDFDKELDSIRKAKNPGDISYHERAIRPLFIELQLALPRIETDIIDSARQRRRELTQGQ